MMRLLPLFPPGPRGLEKACFRVCSIGWTSSYRNSSVSPSPLSISICAQDVTSRLQGWTSQSNEGWPDPACAPFWWPPAGSLSPPPPATCSCSCCTASAPWCCRCTQASNIWRLEEKQLCLYKSSYNLTVPEPICAKLQTQSHTRCYADILYVAVPVWNPVVLVPFNQITEQYSEGEVCENKIKNDKQLTEKWENILHH